MTRWPNLFLIGPPRAGTTSLWQYLGGHPEIYMSPMKEPQYFNDRPPPYVPAVSTESDYLALCSAFAMGARPVGMKAL